MVNHDTRDSFLFIAGLGIGAGATWFFGTRSGRKAQKKLVRLAEDGRDRIAESSREFLDKGKDLAERSLEIAGETSQRVGQMLHLAHR